MNAQVAGATGPYEVSAELLPSGPSAVAIALIVLAVVVLLAVAAFVVYKFHFAKKRQVTATGVEEGT